MTSFGLLGMDFTRFSSIFTRSDVSFSLSSFLLEISNLWAQKFPNDSKCARLDSDLDGLCAGVLITCRQLVIQSPQSANI